METVPIGDLNDRLTEIVDRATREHDRFTITRHGRPCVVLLSVAEWESMRETLEILASRKTRAELDEAITAEAHGDLTREDEMAELLRQR